jgi:hypothetical protein
MNVVGRFLHACLTRFGLEMFGGLRTYCHVFKSFVILYFPFGT